MRLKRSLAPIAVAVLMTVALAIAIPNVVNDYWLFAIISGLVAVILMQSMGILVGRLGVLALCQLSFAGVGAWVVQWCNVHSIPGGFFVWTVIGGLAAVPLAGLVGLTALRLRGPTLAVATFAVAGATDVIWGAGQFPGEATAQLVGRPSLVRTDPDYFVFALVVVAVGFVVLDFIDRGRLGTRWVEVRFSERAAAAHGINVPAAKMSAFIIAGFIAGIAGALMVGQQGQLGAASFTSLQSTTLFALAVMVGVHNFDAALIGGLMFGLMPAIVGQLGINSNIPTIAFGVLAVFALKAGRGQMGQSDMMRSKRRAKAATNTPRPTLGDIAWSPRPTADGPPALSVTDLTVRFGSVAAVADMHVEIARGEIVALVGPNGAGKSTFINAVSGLVAVAAGSIDVVGTDVTGRSPSARAKLGVRRSFQQLAVPTQLTVGAYLQSLAGRKLTSNEIQRCLAWFDCPAASVHISTLDVGARRILEVAGLAASGADVLLLDEPAAGQAEADSRRLAAAIAEIPARTGSAVLLVEHDMEIVREICTRAIVMDAGRLLAEGHPDAVLRDPEVVRAYLGTAVVSKHTDSDAFALSGMETTDNQLPEEG